MAECYENNFSLIPIFVSDQIFYELILSVVDNSVPHCFRKRFFRTIHDVGQEMWPSVFIYILSRFYLKINVSERKTMAGHIFCPRYLIKIRPRKRIFTLWNLYPCRNTKLHLCSEKDKITWIQHFSGFTSLTVCVRFITGNSSFSFLNLSCISTRYKLKTVHRFYCLCNTII